MVFLNSSIFVYHSAVEVLLNFSFLSTDTILGFFFFFFLMFCEHLHFLLIEGNHNSSLLLNTLLSFLSYRFYRYFKVLSDKPFARYIYCTYLLSHFTYDNSLSSYCFFPFLFHLSKFSVILGGDIFSCNLLKAL